MPPVPQSFVVAAKRTPFGAFGGKLKSFTAAQLGGFAGKAVVKELPEGVRVDQVFFGNVTASDITAPYFARHVGHLSGCDVETPALTVNRLCGSGIQSLINAVQTISLGEAEVCLTGGAENMSHSPFMLSGETRWGTKYGSDLILQDSLSGALVDHNVGHGEKTAMGITAENLAKKYGISRADCDAYAAQSQKRWAEAQKAGAFDAEIVPVPIPSKKDPSATFTVDEHPRPQTTMETLAKLRPVFLKDGTVTAGNASGISDGGAANIVMSEEAVKKYGVKPLARVAGYAWSACAPETMGLGPVASCQMALKRAGKTMADMDLIDVNEAFAAQWLAVQKELDLPSEKSNLFGGAVALGHPLGASGARIIANLTHNLHRLDKKWAIGSACIGGGQGVAVVLERV